MAAELYGVALAALGIAYAAVCITTAAFMLWRRALQPIRAHQPWVLAAQAVVMSAFAVYVCLKVSFGSGAMSCSVAQALDAIGFFVIPQIYLVRTLRLMILHSNTAHIISRALSNDSVAEPTAFGFRLRRLSQSGSFILSAVLLGILLAVSIVTAPANHEIRAGECGSSVGTWVVVSYLALAFLLMAVLAFAIRNFDDSFYLLVELRWMPFVLFLETAVWAVCQLVPDMRHSIGDFPLTAAAVLVALTISWAISLLMPLIVSLLHPIAELTSAEKQSLSGLLTTQAGYDSFHDFLKLEFSIENLYFWSEVNLYRQHAERLLMSSDESLIDEAIGELLDIARGIYADFIKDSAPNEVNISAPIRKRIDTVMEQFASHSGKEHDLWSTAILEEFVPSDSSTSVADGASPAIALVDVAKSNSEHPAPAQPPSPPVSARGTPLEQLKRVSLITSTSAAVEAASFDRFRSRSIGAVIYARSSPEFAQLCGVFNAAQAEVLDLMSRDSYARYLGSPQHAAIVEAWKRDSVIGGSRRARSLYGSVAKVARL